MIGPIIEVATIDDRHRLPGLLKEFGTKVILRLGMDPVLVPSEAPRRSVTVDRISPGSESTRRAEIREIGWANLPDHMDDCERVKVRLNQQTITERAAIGVMLLLIHELEGGVMKHVLPIGSGGNYLVNLEGRPDPVQVEVSGIKVGEAGEASSRLHKKQAQIHGEGFASVTTFQYGRGGEPHSFLHFKGHTLRRGRRDRRRPGKS